MYEPAGCILRTTGEARAGPLLRCDAMKIDFALLADYAEVVNGKLYLMGGGWDTTTAAQLPAAVRMAIAVGVRIGWNETDVQFPVLMTIEDDDGREYVRIQGVVSATRAPGATPGSTQLSQVAANVPLQLPALGGYRVHIVVGEGEQEEERNLPFRVQGLTPAV